MICSRLLVPALLLFGCMFGCDGRMNHVRNMPRSNTRQETGESWHKKNGWVAEKFFADTKVIELCRAIEANDLEGIQRAIDNGADVNTLGKDNITPLLWAVPENHPERMKILLEAGANPNICIKSNLGIPWMFVGGDSVTHMAARSAFDYFDLVFDHGGDPKFPSGTNQNPPIFSVIEAGLSAKEKKRRIEKLVKLGADINQPGSDYSGGTPPILAAVSFGGQYDLAMFLLELGAVPTAYDRHGSSTLAHILARQRDGILRNTSREHLDQYIKLTSKLEQFDILVEEARIDTDRWRTYNTEFASCWKFDEIRLTNVADAFKLRNGLDRLPKLTAMFLEDFSSKIANRFDEYTIYKWVELEFLDKDGHPRALELEAFVDKVDRFHSDFVAIKWKQQSKIDDVVFIDIEVAEKTFMGEPTSSVDLKVLGAMKVKHFRVASDRVGSSASIKGYINRDPLPAGTMLEKASWFSIVTDKEATEIVSAEYFEPKK